MIRVDGRAQDQLRPIHFELEVQEFAEGSVLISAGRTKVLCAVSVEERLPRFLKGRGQGWVTAEYSMLPRSTLTRTPREVTQGRPGGRTQEIQRLIGRSLRAITDLSLLGERSLHVDCDVIQADGGTRTAAITGAYVALAMCCDRLVRQSMVPVSPLTDAMAAVSVGIVNGRILLDLCYEEDCRAESDFNIVMTRRGQLVEVQGTAEGRPFSRAEFDRVLEVGEKGIRELFAAQQSVLDAALR